MTPHTIRIEELDAVEPRFRAISGTCKSEGRTAGEALDALLATGPDGNVESSSILIQRFMPDAYFTLAQYDRMQQLLARRDMLTAQESTELDALIDAELEPTIARSEALRQATQQSSRS